MPVTVFFLCASFTGHRNKVGPKRDTKVQQRTFLASFDFLSWFALASHSKMLNLPVTWPHVSGISIPNLLMTQQTLLNGLLVALSKGKNSSSWKNSSCGQAQSFQVCSRSKNGFRISKEIFIDKFQKKALLAIPFSVPEIRTQFSKCLRVPIWDLISRKSEAFMQRFYE